MRNAECARNRARGRIGVPSCDALIGQLVDIAARVVVAERIKELDGDLLALGVA